MYSLDFAVSYKRKMFMKLTAGANPRRKPLKGASIRSALLENIRLGWKSLTRTKYIGEKENSLVTLTKLFNVIKPFFSFVTTTTTEKTYCLYHRTYYGRNLRISLIR
jgi:hypothetical protein